MSKKTLAKLPEEAVEELFAELFEHFASGPQVLPISEDDAQKFFDAGFVACKACGLIIDPPGPLCMACGAVG